MYGIIIEGVRYMIEDHYGSATLALVLERAHVSNFTFSTHDRYSEKIIPNLLIALADITGNSVEEVGILAGRYFVRFMMKYGHAELLKVLGRRFADFLKGLDSLHEYFRFSYPRIRPPSFYCDRETTDGLTLHYRSRRSGYVSYVMGQLIEIAKVFFEQDITVELARKEEKKGFQYVLLRVTFDNRDYNTDQLLRDKNTALNEFLPVDSLSVLNMFPYFIAFNKRMEIVVVGKALSHIIPELIGKRIDEEFDLLRPCVKFTWDACQHHLNNLFELETMYPVQKKLSNVSVKFAVNDRVEEKIKLPGSKENNEIVLANGHDEKNGARDDEHHGRNGNGNYLHLKGPMVYLRHSDVNIYLPTVLIETLDDLFELGLYLNDYSASDCNREIIMASVQKSDDLKELLKREKEKSRTLAKNMREIDQARKTAKELLSQMMPREIANELLQTGKRTVTLCEAFDEVTIAFTKIVDFNALTNDMPPMSVVSLLNTTFSLFDDVVSRHGVYKVETVGESYMVSCGVPYPTQNHAEYVADTSLDMVRAVESISTTTVEGKAISIKIGMHSGSVVGGVVGLRAPRYCLFGDTVNCASRLESHNKQGMTIQVSVKTKVLLENFAPSQFQFENRGKINLKGKGEMLAFGLVSKKGAPRSEKYPLLVGVGTGGEADDESAVYTPIDDFDDNSRASTMSRMSISMAGTRSRGSRTSNSSMSSGQANENDDSPDRDQAAKKTTPVHDNSNGLTSDQNEDAKREKRRAKELSKERKRKEKLERAKDRKHGHDDNQDQEKETPPQTPKTEKPKEEKPDQAPAQTRAQPSERSVVRGAETLGASTSNKAFLSVHNPPVSSGVGFEKPPAPDKDTQKEQAVPEQHHNGTAAESVEPNVFSKMKRSANTVSSTDAVETIKATDTHSAEKIKSVKTKDVESAKPLAKTNADSIKPLKATAAEPVKPAQKSLKANGVAEPIKVADTKTVEQNLKSVKTKGVEAMNPVGKSDVEPIKPLKAAKTKNENVVKSANVEPIKANGHVTQDESPDEQTIKKRNKRDQLNDEQESLATILPSHHEPPTESTISKVMASKGRKGNQVTADQIKEEARSIVANQMKAMEDIMRPAPMDKTAPLPPISQLSMEEELERLNLMKKSPTMAMNGSINQDQDANGYVVAVVNENLPAECICGRYKEAQVIKTKACRLM